MSESICAECPNGNGVIGNGHAAGADRLQSILQNEYVQKIGTFIMTIYDILIFLAVSVGYISQVSTNSMLLFLCFFLLFSIFGLYYI